MRTYKREKYTMKTYDEEMYRMEISREDINISKTRFYKKYNDAYLDAKKEVEKDNHVEIWELKSEFKK